jgi:hypothetical protein
MAVRRRRSISHAEASSKPSTRAATSRGSAPCRIRQRTPGNAAVRSPDSFSCGVGVAAHPGSSEGVPSATAGTPRTLAASAAIRSAHSQRGSGSPATRRASSTAVVQSASVSRSQGIRTRMRSLSPSTPGPSPFGSEFRTAATIA